MPSKAWENQSASLVAVQQRGSGLEKEVKEVLGWNGGRVVYDREHNYCLQVDAVFPSQDSPETLVSVTYTNPDTRGHSNENKLQLKIGELALLKGAHPQLKTVLAIGGSGEAWLPYVLQAFRFFYDEVLFLWEEPDRRRLLEIGQNPQTVILKHPTFWDTFHRDRATRSLSPPGTNPPCCSVRYDVLDALKAQTPIVYNPSLIQNPIARLCMRRSFDLTGAEWQNYTAGRWDRIEMSRNYFNPLEAAVEITLSESNLAFEGGLARDVPVRSLLHDLGMNETSLSEDFVLYSERLDQPVYIQCKASGGGRGQHGKNIQNRTKEQTARSIFYTCSSADGQSLNWNQKAFHWISVLDGNWGVTKAAPLKYVHMLEQAGYDKIFCAADLLTDEYTVRSGDNPLSQYLVGELDCRRI